MVVQVADDPDFTQDVKTVYNNDKDNSSGLGVGTDKEYFETYEGRLMDAKGVEGRYVRLYSKGSTYSALNRYTEVEVWAPAGAMTRAATLGTDPDLPHRAGSAAAPAGPAPAAHRRVGSRRQVPGALEQAGLPYDPDEYHGPILYYTTLPFAWLSAGRRPHGDARPGREPPHSHCA